MKPQIKNWENMPPNGGWRISIGIKGQTFAFNGKPHSIVRSIAQLQKKNNDYKGDAWIWNYCNSIWCARTPDRCTAGSGGKVSVAGGASGRSKVLTYLAALKSLVKSGLQPVGADQANERAQICSKCPFNRRTEKCGACIATAKLLTKALLGKRRTTFDGKLSQCAVCGCELKAKVHYPLNEGDKNEYPANCWCELEKAEKA